jgi:hypothetical protein
MIDKIFRIVTRTEFFSEYWLKQPFYQPVFDTGYFDDLLTMADVLDLICRSRFPDLSLVRRGIVLPVNDYCSEMRWQGMSAYMARPDEVIQQFEAGATLQFRGLQFQLEKIGMLTRLLEVWCSVPVAASAFLSPPGGVSFGPHADSSSTLTIQIAGNKIWRLPRQVKSNSFADAMTVIMGPGNVLYLPPHWWHHTLGGSDISLSVSFALKHLTLSDLLAEIISELSASVPLGDPLPLIPPDVATDLGDADLAGIMECIASRIGELDAARLRAFVARWFEQKRLAPRPAPVFFR